MRSDDPADIQAEVEERLAGLEPGVEVLAVERIGGGRSPALRIFLDRAGGVDLELCARVTHHLRDLLARLHGRGVVARAGAPADEARALPALHGPPGPVRTREAIEGRNDFKGELVGADDRGVSLAGEWGTVTVPHERIRRSNLVAQAPTGKTGRQK